jgi:two-component system, OmpR family, sensor kinase
VLAMREAGIALSLAPDASLLAACDADDAEALLWRVLASLGAACGPSEQITARLAPVIVQGRALARLECALPADLAREENLFSATARPAESAINAGLFGAGFAFRLARAEARAAGGSLVRDEGLLVLTLPLLTMAGDLPADLASSAG